MLLGLYRNSIRFRTSQWLGFGEFDENFMERDHAPSATHCDSQVALKGAASYSHSMRSAVEWIHVKYSVSTICFLRCQNSEAFRDWPLLAPVSLPHPSSRPGLTSTKVLYTLEEAGIGNGISAAGKARGSGLEVWCVWDGWKVEIPGPLG